MPRRTRLSALSIALLAGVSGFALAGLVAQPGSGGGRAGSAWFRAAWAQRPGAEVDPAEWQRLAGPLPYRPDDAGSGWLREEDVGRAVELIADLGVFFAKLSETDPNRRAGAIWAKSEAAYGAASEDLRAAAADGRFRIVVTEGSSLAITRRGEEIWIDSDLAGDWDVARVRQARRNGDDWSDLAVLSGLLFDLWRARGSDAAKAWLEQQRTTMDLPQESQWESGAGASLLTRYGVLKQLYLKASLLRAATADSFNAALWRDRALRLGIQIETLLRADPEGGSQGALKSALRDDWAAYQTQIEQTAAERTWLVLAPRRPSSARVRTGEGPSQATEAAGEAEDAAADTTIEMIVPAGRAGADADPAALKDRIDELEAARARDRAYIAQLLARTAGAARAAEDARAALTTAQSASKSESAALATAQDRAAGYEAEAARLAGKLAAAESAAEGAEKAKAGLQRQLAEAQGRAANAESAATAAETVGDAAKDEVARLTADLAAARSDSESAAAERDGLRRRAEALAAQLDQAQRAAADLRARLDEAEKRAAGAEAEVVRLGDDLTAARSAAESAADDRADLQRQLAEAQDRADGAEAAASAAETVRDAAEEEISRLAADLAAARSGSESAAAAQDRLHQQAEDLTAELARARQTEADLRARLAETEARAAGAEAEVARLGEDLTALRAAAGAATDDQADLQRQLAEARDRVSAAEEQAAGLDADLIAAQADRETAAAENTALQEQLAAAQDRAAAAETDLAAASAAAADLKQQLADRNAEVARFEADAAGRATALRDAEAKTTQLESRIDSLQAAAAEAESERATLETAQSDLKAELTAARAQAEANGVRAREAEAAAAQAGDQAQAAERALAASRDELARLRNAQTSAPAPSAESRAARTSAPTRPVAWQTVIVVAVLFLAGLGGLLTVVWRRIARSHAVPAATESLAAAAPDEPQPASAPGPAAPRPRGETTSIRTAARPATSATIVEAVRRRDWPAADSQFAELSGISAPRLGELLADPSGEMLALACRAADLDRLTFATLYLLQGEGRAVADPETVADAVSLFERTGPAEAHRRLAERVNGNALSS